MARRSKNNSELSAITSKEIEIMNLTARLATLEREVVQSAPAYERLDELSSYLIAEYDDGRLTREQVGRVAEIVGATLRKEIGLSVTMTFTFSVEAAFDEDKDSIVNSLVANLSSTAGYSLNNVQARVQDWNNAKF